MKIDVFNFLLDKRACYVKINNKFIEKINLEIKDKFSSIRKLSEKINTTNYEALIINLRTGKHHKLETLIEICRVLDIPKKELFSNILSFFALGSNTKKEVFLPKYIDFNENFAEGYALYLAEGDNGSNGKKKPRKVRFTNSDINIIKYFYNWLNEFFPNNKIYINIIAPKGACININHLKNISKILDITPKNIKSKKDSYNKIIKYRICLDSAVLIDFLLDIKELLKESVKKESKLRKAYIRGMMAGEGTVYFNRSRYVRIEMRNKNEIWYLHDLLKLEGYLCEKSLRKERENMWSIYIGAKQLEKFYNEIGFGASQKRQDILRNAVNKKLRKNQFG